MFSVYRRCFRATLASLAVIAATTAAHADPVISPPAVVIVNNPEDPTENPEFLALSIMGSGFGEAVSSSKIEIANGEDPSSPVYSYAATDTRVVVWKDDRIVIKLPVQPDHPRATIELCGNVRSNTVTAERYDYTWLNTFPLGNQGANGLPLALANDGQRGYLLEEFGVNFKQWDLATGVLSKAGGSWVSSMNCPSDDNCFANAFFNASNTDTNNDGIPDDPNHNAIPDDPMSFSASGESVIIDNQGRVWFSQGGAGGYGGLAANHSRIISYDPSIPANQNPYRVYNVPGDNNGVNGLAWDGERIWFASMARSSTAGTFCPQDPLIFPRLVSFDPDQLASAASDPSFRFNTAAAAATCNGGSLTWDTTAKALVGQGGTCSNNASRACYNSNDCVLAEYVCPANITDDSACFHEYPLHLDILQNGYCKWIFGTGMVGHLAVSSLDGAIWFTSYIGIDFGSRPFLGRFDPNASPGQQERHYPLHYFGFDNPVFPNAPYFLGGPWEIIEAADGDMIATLDNEHQLARFDMSRVDDPACLDLVSNSTDCDTNPDSTCYNPCFEIVTPPGFDHVVQQTHSVTEDAQGRAWFTQYGFLNDLSGASSVGYWKADRSGIVMFPSPSLYSGSNYSCPINNVPFYGFSGAGITIDGSGNVWFADFCRKRIGKLHKRTDDPVPSAATIISPVLAIVNDPDAPGTDPDFVAVAINGSGFGPQVSGSKVKVRDTTHDLNTTHIYSATSTRVVLWTDTRIVIKLPPQLDHPRVWIQLASDNSQSTPVTAERYSYDYFATNSGAALSSGTNPMPTALAVDPNESVYLLEGFHLDLKRWTAANAVTKLANFQKCPSPGCFAMQLGSDLRTNTSVLGESTIVDSTGKIWFSQGGGYNYTGAHPNHSRIVSYDPVTSVYKTYNIPGDDNEISGLAWDASRGRIWFAQHKRQRCIGFACATAQPAKLTSFNPSAISSNNSFDFVAAVGAVTCNGGSLGTAPSTAPTVGSCSNNSLRSCFTPHDCVLISQVCPAGVTDDTACYHEYPVSDASYISRLQVTEDGSALWYSNYLGSTANLGRLELSTGAITRFPAHYGAPGFFPTGPTTLDIADNGDVLFAHPSRHTIARLDGSRIDDPACTALASTTTNCTTAPDATCANPCIEERIPSGFSSVSQSLQGVDEASDGRAWFGQSGMISDIRYASSVGFWKSDGSDVVLFPTPQIYAASGSTCSSFGGFSTTDLAVSPSTGGVWFTDYCRKRIGRLQHLVENSCQ
jgi:streptogramin lyase